MTIVDFDYGTKEDITEFIERTKDRFGRYLSHYMSEEPFDMGEWKSKIRICGESEGGAYWRYVGVVFRNLNGDTVAVPSAPGCELSWIKCEEKGIWGLYTKKDASKIQHQYQQEEWAKLPPGIYI